MNGLGNDFVVLDARRHALGITPALASAIAARKEGVGCDQVILLEPSSDADVFMRILNADGSESGACGNATRCVAALLSPRFAFGSGPAIETASGLLKTNIRDDGFVSVDMGEPCFDWDRIPLSRPFADTRTIELTHELRDGRVLQDPSVVNVGNPHCIFWVTDPGSYPLEEFGPALEHDSLFPERANISLAEVVSPHRIKLRVWERGAGITLACGTGACAAAAAAARSGKARRNVDVELPGGVLDIEWREEDGHILMTGPVEFEFDGVLHLNGNSVSYERTRPR